MEELALQQPELIGRENELNKLKHSLDNAIDGSGSALLLSGEAGIGKTWLAEEFRRQAVDKDVKILSGAALDDQTYPFLIFSKALTEMERPLFEEQVYKHFTKIFAVDLSGNLIAEASPEGEEELGAETLAGMLSAVQDFVRDSFDSGGEQHTGLGRIEYGDMKVLIEHAKHLFLAAIFKGAESGDMREVLKKAVKEMKESQVEPLGASVVQDKISALADIRFLVRRELAGVQLDKERVRIADEVLGIIVEMAKSKPLLLMLEDLHWADESSLFVLSYLARNVREENILILGTLRPEDSSALKDTIDKMQAEDTVTQINLERLGGEKVVTLINSICPKNAFPSTLFESISAKCEGNPFFVTEMLRHMTEAGNIARQDGEFVLVDDDYVIPGTIEEMAHQRLQMLEPDSMALAEYASCIGREFDREVMFSLQSLRNAPSAFDKLLSAGILAVQNGSAEFTHSIFKDVTYGSIGERWKVAYHKSIGGYYESANKGRLDDVLYELARHFSRSNEHQKAFDYCLGAAGKAENAFAPEQAAVFYNAALCAQSKSKIRTGQNRNEILERLGDVQRLYGDYENAIDNYRKVKEAIEDNEIKARMLRNIGSAYENKGEMDRSLEHYEMAKNTLAENMTMEFGRILVGEGYVHWRKGEYDTALPLFLRAMNIFEDQKDERKDMGDALRAIGNVHLHKGEHDDALIFYTKSLAVMRKIGDNEGISAALNNMGLMYREMNELDKALEHYGQSLEIDEKIGDKHGLAGMHNNIGLVYFDKGQLDKALEHYKQSLNLLKNIGNIWGIAVLLNNSGMIYHAREELDKALEYYGQSLEKRKKIGEKRAIVSTMNNLARLHLDLGDLQKALDVSKKALEISIETGAKNYEAMSRLVTGMVFRERREFEKAEEEFDNAIEMFKEEKNRFELAKTFYEYAFLFRAKNEPGKAKGHLENALSIFSEMGMKLWEEKCRKSLEGLADE